LAKDIIVKKWEHIKKFTDIPISDFLEAIEITLNSTYFLYKNKIYKQIDGCAMGASISSVVAQLVLEDLEETVISQLNFNLPFFYRYVDDCILAIPRDKKDFILNIFNSYHQKLQFTIELEQNKTIHFLDITLHNKNNKIKTEWYTKKTWSSRYTNFNSQHPLSQKKSVVIGLADRAIQLTDVEYRQRSIGKAKQALLINNYPKTLIDSIFKKRIHRYYNIIQHHANKNNKKTKGNNYYVTLPYIQGLSEQIKNLLSKCNIPVAHKGHNLLKGHFSKLKTKTAYLKKSHVVYEIPCNSCNGVYIGQTSQYLKARLQSHKYDKKNQTALTKHEKQHKHSFNYDKTRILRTEIYNKKREIFESMEIKKNQNAINDKKDINNLSKIYFNIL
jgi:hypothetical protein